MFGGNTKKSAPPGDRAYFAPANPTYIMSSSLMKSSYIRYKENFGPEQFRDAELLLLQDGCGSYLWTFFDGLFDRDHKVPLYSCTLSHNEADFIVKNRVLFIKEDDIRLSDFSILSRVEIPPSWDKAAETFDIVTRHLASRRPVTIYGVDGMGNKIANEIKTADYFRAKQDIAIQPENKRNMRRFCNRQSPNGEGPSNLQSRICPGYVKSSFCLSKSISLMSSHRLLLNSSRSSTTGSDSDTLSATSSSADNISPYNPTRRYRKHSTAYYLMRLAFYPPERLEAEQHRHDLAHARREKKREKFVSPSQPSRRPPPPQQQRTVKAVKRALDFILRRNRRCSSSGDGSPPNGEEEEEEEEECRPPAPEDENRQDSNESSNTHLQDSPSDNSTQPSTAPSRPSFEEISRMTIPSSATTPPSPEPHTLWRPKSGNHGSDIVETDASNDVLVEKNSTCAGVVVVCSGART